MPKESIKWITNGRSLNEAPVEEPTIGVEEFDQSVMMPDAPGPYGIAVNAPLGVSMIKALWQKVNNEPDTNPLKALLSGSFAITFDKSVLLKTLSQPKCEGIRFYLCLKQSEKNPAEQLLSLVTVGVDEAGKDLLYEYQPGIPIKDIPTRSLIAEYGHPPWVMSQSGPSIDPFVLFKLSQ